MHEIGTRSPYRLDFAGKGNSGASFGFMQGDLAVGQRVVNNTFVQILTNAGASTGRIKQLLAALSVHQISNPLSPEDTAFVNQALAAGSVLVDAMDQAILSDVYADLEKCVAVARASGRKLSGKAMLYFALWINMSGHPTALLAWLSGEDPNLPVRIGPPPSLVAASDARSYLMATHYYVGNPGNAAHLDESVQAGAVLLPPDAIAS